jgi:hypothetical protein
MSNLEFTRSRLDCATIMRGALKAHGISDLDKAHANALHSLSMLKLHKIAGQPDAADLLAVRDDLIEVAKIIDKLVLAMGQAAAESSHKIDLDYFTDRVFGAVDGEATSVLNDAANEISLQLLEAAE